MVAIKKGPAHMVEGGHHIRKPNPTYNKLKTQNNTQHTLMHNTCPYGENANVLVFFAHSYNRILRWTYYFTQYQHETYKFSFQNSRSQVCYLFCAPRDRRNTQ